MIYPNYDESIVSVMQSIMKFFNLEPYHPSLGVLDEVLKRHDYEHVVFMVNDGLGYHNLMEHLDETSFMRQHLVKSISSVFPPTTTAATTSLLSGKYPIEHGWLGWNVFVEDLSETVTLFLNQPKTKRGSVYSYSVGQKYFPYKGIVSRINNETKNRAYTVSPFGDTPYDFNNYQEMYTLIKNLCIKDERSYIYAYYNEPDGLMHTFGNMSDRVHQKVLELDENIRELSGSLRKTLLVVTADHGHIDVENLFIEDYPDLKKIILRETSIEPRACNFYITEEYRDEFIELFNTLFGDKFKLLSKEEVLSLELFGKDESRKNLSSIGDFIAIAISNYTLNDSRKDFTFKSHHAGATERERDVPLIIVDCY